MDSWIDEYVEEANVVVPTLNPNFDSSKFDPKSIGVQAGGLKMPPAKKSSAHNGPPKTLRTESMLGWVGKGVDVSVGPNSMKVSTVHSQSFLTNANLDFEGP